MSQSKKPIPIPFLGIDLSGNPTQRPFGSATVCDNFRIMPGGWLRLRGGRVPRLASVASDIPQFMPARTNSMAGGGKHLIQTWSTGVNQIWELDLAAWTMTLVEDCGPNIADRAPVAYAVANEFVIYGNGYGEQNRVFNGAALRSVPGLSYWKPGQTTRFLGLLPAVTGTALNYTPSTVSGGQNLTTGPVRYHVGLFNSITGHLSNVVGYVVNGGMSGGNNVVTLNLGSIAAPWHSTAERDETLMVFYSTLQGGSVPYLILNATGTAPLTAAMGTASVSLNLTALNPPYGYLLDPSREAPQQHYPPRQMRSICYVNGRLIGILRPGSEAEVQDPSWQQNYQPSPVDASSFYPTPFEYQVRTEELCGIVWSDAIGDRQGQFTGGDPLQIWRPTSFSPTPNGERPVWCATAPNDSDAIVWTATRTYMVREQADQLMEWSAIADFGLEAGIGEGRLRTVKRTRHGLMWVNNLDQVCLVTPNLEVVVVSEKYDALLRGAFVNSAAYWFDPLNQIDRYQVWRAGGSSSVASVCHDFWTGSAYTTSGASLSENVRSSAQVEDASGKTHMLVAAPAVVSGGSGGLGMCIFTVEGQPDQNYQVPTKDLVFGGSGLGPGTAESEIPDATYETNWTDMGAMDLRKEVDEILVLGDQGFAPAISQNALSGEVFSDYQQVTAGTGKRIDTKPVTQQTSARAYLARLGISLRNMFAFKARFTMKSHSADYGSYFASPASDGLLDNNFYGSIQRMELKAGDSDNRG